MNDVACFVDSKEMIKKFAQLEEKSKDQGLERQELENRLLTVEDELKRSEKSKRELNNKVLSHFDHIYHFYQTQKNSY